jgi:trehalose-phosphatase
VNVQLAAGDEGPALSEPVELAHELAILPRPVLFAFDCDGVLAPLTDHADNSVLTRGVGKLLADLSGVDDVDVAVLSGRSLDGLGQFGFAPSIHVSGSYGGERRGRDRPVLSDEEQQRLRQLDELAVAATDRAGDGAWVERKPTSVVIHVREADAASGRAAIDWARERQAEFDGHTCHEGDNVLELMTRPADKGAGLDGLRSEFDVATCVYVGDDVPDEDAFARLTDADVGIKVGSGPTRASHRLADTGSVEEMLERLVASLTS